MVFQSTKKRKLSAASAPIAKRPKAQLPSKKAKSARRNVDVSSLKWRSVGEEFGGLEVIENVQVVKDGDQVRFLAEDDQTSASSHPDAPFEGFSDNSDDKKTSHDTRETSNFLAGDKRTDSSHANGEAEIGDGRDNKKQKQRQKKKKKVPSENINITSTGGTSKKTTEMAGKITPSAGNSFTALAGVANDEDEGIDVAAWVPLNLTPQMLSAVAKLGFAKPTQIQQRAIPSIFAGGDVVGKAQTGSGKTLAFGIPLVEKWLELHDADDSDGSHGDATKSRRGPMAVVLSPTRELAKQLGDHIKALSDSLPSGPYICVVTGGLSIQKQQRQLEKADIVIGTPGRLWEVLDGDASLQDAFARIRFLVVDEADRLFKAGQFKEAELIIGALDKRDPEKESDGSDESANKDGELRSAPRQTLVFSATFDKDLQTKLSGKARFKPSGEEDQMAYLMKCLKFRSEPEFIDVNPVSQMAHGLKEGLIECGAMEKDLYLYSVLILNPGRRSLVFTNSISAVRRLTPLMQNLNLTALPLHSQMAQKARLRSLERFTASSNTILIATDVAARGLDIKEVDQVLHYHVPRSADTYVHRSGRTARGDNKGVSILLCSPDEVVPTRRLASKIHAEQQRREHVIHTLPIDRKVVSRLKSRLDLAKRIADSILAKEKAHSSDQWLRNAADELGVEYDSDEFEETANAGSFGGRGGGRRKKEKAAQQLTKAELGALKAQLREELSRRVNLGVSERYITGGRVDIGKLLKEKEQASGGIFLGAEAVGLDWGL